MSFHRKFVLMSFLCILSMVTQYPSHPAAKTWALSLILYRGGNIMKQLFARLIQITWPVA